MSSRVVVSLRVACAPNRAFEAFTRDIGLWWRPNELFQFTTKGAGRLAFEAPRAGDDGRLTETLPDGQVFEIGPVLQWRPGEMLAFGWRQASFAPDQTTRVEVRFEPVATGGGIETRVTVQHFGWDSVPAAHVARHGFPSAIFLQRHGEWWRVLLGALGAHVADISKSGPPTN